MQTGANHTRMVPDNIPHMVCFPGALRCCMCKSGSASRSWATVLLGTRFSI
ncbi:hypothetical protein ChYMVSRgp1 [Chicory yellow mottle virus satellite RNA]|uniref:hypothetical protein n=1 Tax=Chicory yellow mottle virus satellite RNA TaxID=192022 RepID=UPI00000F24F1|nr:hypothetical protein ChYMVSRgp1 [Chicory yellow mottle virus satellite RNA]BAA00623.1 hypothetical protein [Chicory yellow mottle virus satellite RNA]